MNKIFVLKKGKHRSGFFFAPKFIYKSVHKIQFIIEHDCYFKPVDNDDLDINKLFGFSFGMHHKNSIRLGWRPSSTSSYKMEIFYYLYNKGVRTYHYLCDIDCHKTNDVTITCDYKNNCFDISVVTPDGFSIKKQKVKFVYPKFKIGYYLFPYFGGNKTAPKTMHIFVGYNQE